MATKLAPGQISDLDPYKFMAVIGKRVIHLGGRRQPRRCWARRRLPGRPGAGCGLRGGHDRDPDRPPLRSPRRTSHR